jgi:hypothetical protein
VTAPVHDITTLTARQRLAAADLVESLAAADLETPSLVNGWTTKDVLAHLVDGTQRSLPRFARAALRHGGTAGANTALVHRSSPPAPDLATATTKAEPVPTPRPPGPEQCWYTVPAAAAPLVQVPRRVYPDTVLSVHVPGEGPAPVRVGTP